MRGVIGLVALLVALAVVGLLVARQLRTTGAGRGESAAGVAAVSASGTPRERSEQTQQAVRDGVSKALEQGAAARREAPEQ